jgi:hypothetical protein
MDFTPKSIVLKNGRALTLRAPRTEDAQTLVDYLEKGPVTLFVQ